MLIEFLVTLAIVLAAVAGYFIGAHLNERCRRADERDVRAIYENRFTVLLQNGASEREVLRLAADQERQLHRAEIEKLMVKNQMLLDQAAKEREALLTRIQAWTPAPEPEKPVEAKGSHIEEMRDEELSEAAAEKLREERIEPTLDGNAFVDLENGALFEEIGELRAWRTHCKRNNLPPTTTPQQVLRGSEG